MVLNVRNTNEYTQNKVRFWHCITQLHDMNVFSLQIGHYYMQLLQVVASGLKVIKLPDFIYTPYVCQVPKI